ncbi:MAG: epoxyqueuosine reductase [Acidobacteriaceae bacterium]
MQVNRWNPELRRWLAEASRAAGFDVVGVADVRAPDDLVAVQQAARFSAWIDAGRAGEMEYLKRRNQQGTLLRGNLRVAMPWVRSAIVCAMNYNFAAAPLSIDPAPPGSGWIARYAWTGRALEDGSCAPTDYHDELLVRLREIESGFLLRAACTARCYVDTGPLVERALAADAGIGWIGKNTCLLNQQLGSWLLLGVIVTSLPVEKARDEREGVHSAEVPIKPQQLHSKQSSTTQLNNVISTQIASIQALDRCGTCTRCIDACPTGALLGSRSPAAPRTMDASRCIAYLTIEKKGMIDPGLRAAMGRHVFGCDICQDVCPWNRKPQEPVAPTRSGAPFIPSSMRNGWDSNQNALQARTELINPALDWLAAMDAHEFNRCFKGSPLERTGRKRLLRNVAIAMGNSGEARFLPQLEAWAAGDDPVLADAAHWARARLLEHFS